MDEANEQELLGAGEIEVVVEEDGRSRTYVGLEVCRGPGVVRLVLTRPYGAAGQTIDIPRSDVRSVNQVALAPQGGPVQRLEDSSSKTA